MQLRAFGPRAVLAELGDAHAALALAAWARGARLPVAEVVPAAETVLFDGVRDPESLRASLAAWDGSAPTLDRAPVEVPVTYDGEDLAFVAELWGTDVAGVVERHTSTAFVSAFCGFAPGFAYLAGLGGSVPRLDAPRSRVPAGAVGLAGAWCGVYPTASPGGWRLLGRTSLPLWDPAREEPALLAPGTPVRFVRA
ncbi:allophanate hydrolase subunit 1 [Nocardioides sp. cx-173]|uniref:5-oxoprolinase subunit B family protein n=1 Tax=Nocardioides sp. cx-173 TaxID=2898796 RepID=UPI001E51DF7B|nr:allophanate hydrolase subunit 1 [Nocardioides sp. cx-173]MCD4527293.1 allophanate hydrolase subunit 1 [Nocardioides sp. cx-173]UGB43593.1 allophanate hydrolase subunit 1 [Nocardioides sp. cx-173]